MLAVFLLLGQLAFMQHALDLDAHPAGEHCKICLLAHGFDHALTGIIQLPDNVFESALPYHRQFSTHASSVYTVFLARGPPVSLLSS